MPTDSIKCTLHSETTNNKIYAHRANNKIKCHCFQTYRHISFNRRITLKLFEFRNMKLRVLTFS